MSPVISVVVPVYNEAESVPELHRQLARVADTALESWEFIFVDDGSRDGTWEALVALQRQDARIRAMRLKRNFGQTPALSCGIDHARGRTIVTMDGDLQNDPADIPRLIAKLQEGYDVVCGWRHQRKDKLLSRRIPSLIANRLIGWLTGVRLHDYGCSLKAMRAEVIKRTPLYAEFHRYVTALVTLNGALLTELKVNHRPRTFGRTKYNLWRTWRVALDMITVSVLVKFTSKPIRVFAPAALGLTLLATVCIGRSWQGYVTPYQDDVLQIIPGLAVLGFWLAGHLLVVGLLAELCLATSHARPDALIAIEEG